MRQQFHRNGAPNRTRHHPTVGPPPDWLLHLDRRCSMRRRRRRSARPSPRVRQSRGITPASVPYRRLERFASPSDHHGSRGRGPGRRMTGIDQLAQGGTTTARSAAPESRSPTLQTTRVRGRCRHACRRRWEQGGAYPVRQSRTSQLSTSLSRRASRSGPIRRIVSSAYLTSTARPVASREDSFHLAIHRRLHGHELPRRHRLVDRAAASVDQLVAPSRPGRRPSLRGGTGRLAGWSRSQAP